MKSFKNNLDFIINYRLLKDLILNIDRRHYYENKKVYRCIDCLFNLNHCAILQMYLMIIV